MKLACGWCTWLSTCIHSSTHLNSAEAGAVDRFGMKDAREHVWAHHHVWKPCHGDMLVAWIAMEFME